MKTSSSRHFLALLVITIVWMIIVYNQPCWKEYGLVSWSIPLQDVSESVDTSTGQTKFNQNSSLIFIDGVPGSGTTLLRAMLDAHPDIACGEENIVISFLKRTNSHWLESPMESRMMGEGGVNAAVLNAALASLILELVPKSASRSCLKNQFVLTHHSDKGQGVKELFPEAKFVLLVRDGRAVATSLASGNYSVYPQPSLFPCYGTRSCLDSWQHVVVESHRQCVELGPRRCHLVKYEQLVLHTKEVMQSMLEFLEVDWSERVLHHDQDINDRAGLYLTNGPLDDVIRPINTEHLTTWTESFPQDLLVNASNVAPMLETLGYNSAGYPPSYGTADQMVADNTRDVRENTAVWKQRASVARRTVDLWMMAHEVNVPKQLNATKLSAAASA